MVFKRIILVIVMTILFFGSSFSYSPLTHANKGDSVILILINQLSFADKTIYQQIDGFKFLEEKAAKGAMNINSAGARSDSNSYLTIGVGSKALGIKGMGESYEDKEKINQQSTLTSKDYYKQQTGIELPKETIIFLNNGKLKNQLEQKFPINVGALGNTLEQNNLKIRVYGNNDTLEKNRYAPLITMNSNGVSFGKIGNETLENDHSRPYGVKTNYKFILQQLNKNKEIGTDLTVLDLGDLYRLEQFKDEMSIEYLEKIKLIVLNELGQFIQQVINQLDQNQTLIVTSPMGSKAAEKEGLLLTPIWIYGNQTQGKLLYSNTTKRNGIVANIDLAPTILSKLGIKTKPVEMIGQSMDIVESSLNLERELEHISVIYTLRQKVLYTYVMWQVFILVLASIIWLSKWSKFYFPMKIGLLSILFSPILFLVTARWTPLNSQIYLVTITIASLTLSLMFSRIKNTPLLFLVIGLVTFLTIFVDTFLGSPLMKRSFLGYDPIIGARYYGIGNEFMGIFLGASILFTSALMHFKKGIFTWILLLVVYSLSIFLLIFPTLGTNAGGAIAGIVSTVFLIFRFSRLSINKRTIIFLISFVVLGLIALVGINYLVPTESQSHIGRALNQLFSGDVYSIVLTIQRKLAMNWKLIKVSSWSKVLASALLATFVIFIKPRQAIKNFMQQYTYLSDGFMGITVGAFTALLVNDSGIVAASTMIIYMAIPVLYLGLINLDLTKKRS